MEKIVTIKLNETDIGQVLDGLEQRRIIWQATAEYLECGSTELSDVIEECSDSEEAQAIADYYQYLIDTIKKQLVCQIVSNSSKN
ncbi:MAG: hypothetical protein LLF76_09305 [Planctomycetaceae bacterium]|nr:hypothetical protein [Planctomycetaceae bacterium]